MSVEELKQRYARAMASGDIVEINGRKWITTRGAGTLLGKRAPTRLDLVGKNIFGGEKPPMKRISNMEAVRYGLRPASRAQERILFDADWLRSRLGIPDDEGADAVSRACTMLRKAAAEFGGPDIICFREEAPVELMRLAGIIPDKCRFLHGWASPRDVEGAVVWGFLPVTVAYTAWKLVVLAVERRPDGGNRLDGPVEDLAARLCGVEAYRVERLNLIGRRNS